MHCHGGLFFLLPALFLFGPFFLFFFWMPMLFVKRMTWARHGGCGSRGHHGGHGSFGGHHRGWHRRHGGARGDCRSPRGNERLGNDWKRKDDDDDNDGGGDFVVL